MTQEAWDHRRFRWMAGELKKHTPEAVRAHTRRRRVRVSFFFVIARNVAHLAGSRTRNDDDDAAAAAVK